jgi:hypothetical protein
VHDRRYMSNGMTELKDGAVLTFYGNWERGLVVKYHEHKTTELECSPSPGGASNSGRYAGVLCTRQPDKKWEDVHEITRPN